jgi:hypothetical protein
MASGDIHAACSRFEASEKLDPKLGTLLNLADCFEKDGRTASAWERFDEAVTLVKTHPDDRGDYALKRRDDLTPRLAKLRLAVTQGAEKLAVYRDGIAVAEEMFGLPIAVDPGPIKLAVRRGDETLDKRSVVAKPAEEVEVALDLAAISKAHPPKTRFSRVSRAQRTAGFAVGAVGLAGLVTFAILEGAAYGQKAKADGVGGCRDGYCSPDGYALEHKAGDLAEAGQWVGVASAAVVAIGATLLLTAPRGAKQPDEASLVITPLATPSAWGLAVGGNL